MAPLDPPQNAARGHSPPYDSENSGDYLSDDDDLSPGDLNVLNTDYSMQKDLTFRAPLQRPNGRYIPSPSDVRTRARTTSTDEKHEEDDWNRPLRLPPRLSSKDPSIHSGHYPPGTAYRQHKHQNAHAYQAPSRRRRPLIDYIKNEWAYTTSATGASLPPPISDDGWEFTTPLWIQACFAPKFQRALLIILALSFLAWGNWQTWAGSRWNEAAALKWSVKQKQKNGEGWFGENVRPEFIDMVQIQTLDEELVPNEASENRLIIIGDVHGCYDELMALLSDCQYEPAKDHLIFTGDLVAKGPSSSAVVDLAISANASCVRGNHEDRVLLAHRDMSTDPLDSGEVSNKNKNATTKPKGPAPGLGSETAEQPLDEESFAHGSLTDRLLARQLTKRQLEWLGECPIILSLGPIDNLGDVSVVHAGLVPGILLSHQDPMGVMSMRTIDLETHVPSSKKKGVAWWMLWNVYQSSLPMTARSTVVYGHDSKRGLNVKQFSTGLDSGCVKGGKLSALVVEGGAGVGSSRVVSVECKDYGDVEKEAIKAHGGTAKR